MSTETLTVQKVEDADGNRHYLYPPTGEQFASVTTVISATQSKPWLGPWQAKLAVKWVIANLAQLDALGPEKFEEEAKAAAERIRDLKRDAGVYAHDVIEALLLWAASPEGTGSDIVFPDLPEHLRGQSFDDIPIESFADMVLTGFTNFVSDHDAEFHASEMPVYNAELRVAGTLDGIAHLRQLDVMACLDFKTGKHLKDVHEQLAMYRRMTECLLPMGQLVPMPQTDAGFVVHLRPEYPRGYRLMEVSAGDDAAGFNRFRRALTLHQERAVVRAKPGKVLYPPLPDGSQPPPQLCDLDGEIHGRVTGPLIRAGLLSLTDVADFTESDVRAIKGVGPKSIDVLASLLSEHGLAFASEKAVA
jgi:hypothetical protein